MKSMDNGKIKIKPYKDVLLCDVYCNGELVLKDIQWALDALRDTFMPPVDVIVKKTGEYSVSIEFQDSLRGGIEEVRRIAFVADKKRKQQIAEYESGTFLKAYNSGVFKTIKEAYSFLKK